MSWTVSRIVLVDRHVGQPRVVAGGPRVSVGQPRFSPDGRALAYVSDETGWWNVHVAASDGTGARPLLVEPHDHAEPAWGPGQRSFAWSPASDAIALCRNEDGFARLVVVGLDGSVTEVAKGWHHGIDWSDAGIVAVRSGARTPPQVTIADPAPGTRRVVARGVPAGLEAGAREPEVVTWRSGDDVISGLLFTPDEPVDRPPLLVDLHGGPTGQAVVRWDGWLRFFTSRGFAVLRPNPRGSTGSGRAFVQDHACSWGDADVADVAAGIEAVGPAGWGDPARVAVLGGSAGALTALLVAARHAHLVRAVVSSYGVTDLFDLGRTTHRFESRYLDEIVGVLPAAAATYRERSPVTHASAITAPLLVLQGDADPVVPPAQAQLLVDAVRAAGGTVEHHVYAGEGHGWSRRETVADELARTWAFLERWVVNA
jgi:dipeptidyl aminopeptidase/acylaminoacyl peptidase